MTLDLSLLPDGGVRWLDAAGAHSDVVLDAGALARNVDGYAFTGRARDGERLRVLVQVREALQVLPGPTIACSCGSTSWGRPTVRCCSSATW